MKRSEARVRSSESGIHSLEAKISQPPTLNPEQLNATHHPEFTRAEKYERLAFTFCKMGTVGLICWLLTPPIFVLLVALAAIGLYARAVALGLLQSRCFLRKPLLIIGFWALVVVADAAWLIITHQG